jgi:hypothetical protein
MKKNKFFEDIMETIAKKIKEVHALNEEMDRKILIIIKTVN